MFNHRDPKPEETQPAETTTIPKVSSRTEPAPAMPAQASNTAGPSEFYAQRSAPVAQGKHEGHVLVGEGVKIVGEIRDCREIEIHGTVEGDLEAEVLIVHANGLLTGNVKTDRTEVHGCIDGDISVKYLLDVKAKGAVAGNIEYGELSVETGGRVVGTLNERSAKQDKPAGATPHRPTSDPILAASKTSASNPTDRASAHA